MVKEDPTRSCAQYVSDLADAGVEVNVWWVQRLIKRWNFTWKKAMHKQVNLSVSTTLRCCVTRILPVFIPFRSTNSRAKTYCIIYSSWTQSEIFPFSDSNSAMSLISSRAVRITLSLPPHPPSPFTRVNNLTLARRFSCFSLAPCAWTRRVWT